MQPEQLGPYKIGRRLGRGGMGTVYEGIDPATGTPVAVKVLAAQLAMEEGFRERFEAEIESLKLLRHPNIVSLLGHGEEQGLLFYSMELVEGKSLEEELNANRRFDWLQVTEIGAQICRALKHAHDRGVVHRDIKPANLMLTPGNIIKLSDFGIAKLFGNTGMTADGGVLGTAEYMAPEQADGRPVTYRCDLYSLGGVLYSLLAGRPPFRASSIVEMLQLQRFAEPEPVRRYASDTPEELEQIVLQLLAKNPEERIPSAMVLAKRLEATRRGISARSASQTFVRGPETPSQGNLSETIGASADFGPNDAIDDYQVASASQIANREKDSIAIQGTVDLTPSPAPKPVPTKQPTVVGPTPSKSTLPGTFVTVAEEDRDKGAILERREPGLVSVQTWALVGSIVAIAAIAWYFLQPASANQLYRKIVARESSERPEDLLDVESEISEFLSRFPRDTRVTHVTELQEELELYRLDRQFQLRARRLTKSDSLTPVERAYLEAVNYAQLNPDIGLAKLQAIVDLYDEGDGMPPTTRRCVALAKRQITRLKNQAETYVEDSLHQLERRLDKADQLRATDPVAARALYEAALRLHGDKSWAQPAIKRVQTRLAELDATPKKPSDKPKTATKLPEDPAAAQAASGSGNAGK